ncbi:hypothetical protein [Nitrospirillum amazonense]|uniref:hypothetical protein n=1 Tax=Nitrospirillum amazonense TaxID=28077 RepID=UPI0011AA2D77|nr:hypothetical protein [Nitrospirillum amazonense]
MKKNLSDRDAIIGKLYPSTDPNVKSVGDIFYREANAKGAFLYSALFMPTILEVEGSIIIDLFSGEIQERFLKKKSEWKGSIQELEASFNFFELPYLFGIEHRMETSDAEDACLCEIIANVWRSLLRETYPERRIIVECLSPEESGSVSSISVSELR